MFYEKVTVFSKTKKFFWKEWHCLHFLKNLLNVWLKGWLDSHIFFCIHFAMVMFVLVELYEEYLTSCRYLERDLSL